jgi:KDO2-lipid IV(A) lauroyltransferase
MGKPYGVESQFFGVTTGTAYGLALFWKKTQKPVFPLYTYWDDQQKFHICIDQAVDLTADLSETNEVITNKFNRILEDIIKRHPDHWMWVHKRWKTFE